MVESRMQCIIVKIPSRFNQRRPTYYTNQVHDLTPTPPPPLPCNYSRIRVRRASVSMKLSKHHFAADVDDPS